MINKVTTIAVVAVMAIAAYLLLPAIATAAPVDVLQTCQDSSTVCKGTDSSTLNKIMGSVVNILLTIVGMISVIMIIIGGIRYTTSNGDASQTAAAKNTILYALVGLVVAIMSFAIVKFVLNRI